MADVQLTPATGVWTLTDVPTEDEDITIGGRVYTFKDATPDPENDEILNGSGEEDTGDNVADAINGLVAGMARNQFVSAVSDGAGVVTLTARIGGALANFVTTVDGTTPGSFGAATLEDGDGDAAAKLEDILATRQANASVISAIHAITGSVD